jgi:two-component system chemotaxis sensor kinase CheA
VTPLAIEAALQASGFVADQLNELSNGAAPDSLASMPAELKDILTQAIEGKSDAARPPPSCACPGGGRGRAGGCGRRQRPGSQRRWQCQRDEEWRTGLARAVQALVPGAAVAAPGCRRSAALPRPRLRLPGRRPGRRWRAKAAAPPSRIVAPPTRGGAKEESIRIDAVKLDALLEVAGESVQAANQAAVLLERCCSSSSKARLPR